MDFLLCPGAQTDRPDKVLRVLGLNSALMSTHENVFLNPFLIL